MNRLVIIITFICIYSMLPAARKALVVGNAAYSEKRLTNTINDAQDIAEELRALGFTVDERHDLDLESFETAIDDFSRSIASTDEVVFFYAGHGVQVGGLNYLLPIGAKIDKESQVKYRSVDCNYILESLQHAQISVIILDACRNNPYTWKRSADRGLARMEGKPGSQYIIYSTAAGSVADDGEYRNSPFTLALKEYMAKPNLVIEEMMRALIKHVEQTTNQRQTPASYGNLKEPFYFHPRKQNEAGDHEPTVSTPTTQAQIIVNQGSILIDSNHEGDIYLDSVHQGRIPANAQMRLSPVTVGTHQIELRTSTAKDSKYTTVVRDQESRVEFLITTTPGDYILVEGGSYYMGSDQGDMDETPIHLVSLSSFYMAKHELTVGEFRDFIDATGYRTLAERSDGADVWAGSTWIKRKDAYWNNPGFHQTDLHPLTCVCWFDAIAYCNWRSRNEGLELVYSINGNSNPSDWSAGTIFCNLSATGYRLPSEAEWEFAARGGNVSITSIYSGSNDIGAVAWYSGNSQSATHQVGAKAANELGLHDLSGNVWEWCWDFHASNYAAKSSDSDPLGAASGSLKIMRGGSWNYNADFSRIANRGSNDPTRRSNYIGLRLVRSR